MYEDILDMLLNYIDSIKDGPKQDLVKKMQCLLNISCVSVLQRTRPHRDAVNAGTARLVSLLFA